MTAAPPPSSGAAGFGSRARQAVSWTAGFQLFRDGLQFGLMLVLVRLLPPEIYGQFGFVTAILSFLTLCSFREFLGHTLIVRDEGKIHYQDHFTAGLWIQVSLFVLVNLVAVGLRWWPTDAPLPTVLHVMSVLFLLDLPSELRVKMLERQLDWRKLRGLHAVALVGSGSLSLMLAMGGAGVYALLLPTLIVPVVFASDLFWTARWRPTWAFAWDRYEAAWAFGRSRILSVGASALGRVTETWWLAAVVGFAMLGTFGRAIALTQLLCWRLTMLMSTSMFPVLARISPRTEVYRRASALYLRSIVWVVIPAAVLGSVLAEPLVALLYGAQWTAVGGLLPWALAGGAIGAVIETSYTLLLAHGQQRRCLAIDLCRLGGTLVALTVALPIGVVAYLAAFALLRTIPAALALRWLIAEEAVTSRGMLQAFLPAGLAGAAALVVSLGLRDYLSGQVGPLMSMGGVALSFSVVYIGLLRVAFVVPLRELVDRVPAGARLGRLLLIRHGSGGTS